jgi:hypothetical protein
MHNFTDNDKTPLARFPATHGALLLCLSADCSSRHSDLGDRGSQRRCRRASSYTFGSNRLLKNLDAAAAD